MRASCKRVLILTAGLFGLALVHAGATAAQQPALPRTAAPEGAEVYFVSPRDGETVTSPVTVVFGLRGMGVAPAGVDLPHTGHHHLIIDAPTPNLDLPIPADANHRHFGAGQTEVTVGLEPGTHTLQLVLGDLNHVPHSNPVISQTITITVKK